MSKLLKETKNKILDLRMHGYSIPEIHRLLGVPKSTALRYANTISILPEYKQRWLDRRNGSKIMSDRRLALAKNRANELVPVISKESLVLIAAALYWAEGAKKDFSLTNSDPELIKVFIRILEKIFDIKKEDLKVSIRLYEDLNINEAINFWSEIIGKDLKGNVSINILNGKKTGKLKYGMCRVRVKKSGLLLKTIFAINKRVCEIISS